MKPKVWGAGPARCRQRRRARLACAPHAPCTEGLEPRVGPKSSSQECEATLEPRRTASASRLRAAHTPTLVARLVPLRLALAQVLNACALCGVSSAQELPPLGGPERDLTGGPQAFVEVRTDRAEAFIGDPLRFEVRMGFERGFLATQLVPLFQRTLDLPVEVRAEWLGDLSGGEWIGAPQAGADRRARRSFALGGGIAEAEQRADEVRGGRSYAVYAFESLWLPTSAGAVEPGATQLRFAFATQFDEDPFHGRVARDRVDASVRAEPLALRVLPLPEAGRPPHFGGAVGRLTLSAEAEPRELEVGGLLKLVLTLEGRGNFGHFQPPPVERLDGLRLVSRREERAAGVLRIECELAVQSERVSEVPAIEFAFFDPVAPAHYESVRSQPLPLRVRRSRAAAETPEPAGAASSRWPYLGTALVAGIALALFVLRRRKPSPAHDAQLAGPRAPGAAAEFEAGLARPGADLGELFAAYLAARLDCPPATVIAPDLAARLERSGAPRELAARAAHLLEGLVAARYGGSVPPAAPLRARELVAALELLPLH